MNIIAAGRFYQAIDDDLPNLKAEVKASCGKYIRRIDRFIQLAIIGAHRCVDGRELPCNTGLYLASGDGPKTSINQSLEALYQQQQQLKPLDFINMVSNAATFYVAQTLHISSVSLFNSHQDFAFQQALELANIDLCNGTTDVALVGSVDECCEPLSVQRQVLNLGAGEAIGEGSYWLLLDKSAKNGIATLVLNKQYTNKAEMVNVIHALSELTSPCIAFATEEIKHEFVPIIDFTHYDYQIAQHHSLTAAIVTEFVVAEHHHVDTLFVINKESMGNYRLLVVRRNL